MTNEVSLSSTSPEVNSQIQPAFVKHTRKYYSINQLMDIISPAYPNIETLAVLYDEMIQGNYNKVNINPLVAVVINQDGTQHKLDYADLKGITDISVPKWYFDNVPHDEFSNIKLRRLDIEATTSETHDGHPYHNLYLRAPPNQNILEKLQCERTEVLETPPIKENLKVSPNIDDLF